MGSTRSVFSWALICLLFLTSGIILFQSLQSEKRQQVLDALIDQSRRQVLARIQGHIDHSAGFYTLLKVREGRELYLEIYHASAPLGPQGFIDRILIQDTFDARVEVAGRFTNLALIRGPLDFQMDILVPTLSPDLLPKLNLFRFDQRLQKLKDVTFSN